MSRSTIRSLLKSLQVPVIQAPMAGGLVNPQLVAAVTNAGGIGSFGFAYSDPEKIYKELHASMNLTKGPINANFFIMPKVQEIDEAFQNRCIEILKELSFAHDVQFLSPKQPYYQSLHDQLEPIWILKPKLLTFHLGIPSKEIIDKAHSENIEVGASATNVLEAKAIQDAGLDFIVAQGTEAGGHRGNFIEGSHDPELPILGLVTSILKDSTIQIPLIASGGIMNGAGISQFMKLGCSAVQMGTAFLTCHEAGTPSSYKTALLNDHHRRTCFTKGFSGRRAKGLRNDFIKYMEDKVTLPFPIQNALTGPIRQKAAKSSNPEYQSLWAGDGYRLCKSMSTLELMTSLEKEYKNTY